MLRVRADDRPSCSAFDAFDATLGVVTFEVLLFGISRNLLPRPMELRVRRSSTSPSPSLSTLVPLATLTDRLRTAQLPPRRRTLALRTENDVPGSDKRVSWV